VLLIGAGGLGSPCAIYLAGMGVGRLGLVDYDDVEIHNLHRQIAHSELSEGVHKAVSGKNTLNRFNSQVDVVAYDAMLSRTNAKEIFQPYAPYF
jgi:molybdopterin/thiamine biosynthesis adenylyltransferase